MKKIVLSNAYKGAVREFVASLVPEGFTLEILNTMNSDELKERIANVIRWAKWLFDCVVYRTVAKME